MDEKGLIWLGSAFWLKEHGVGWIVERFPEMVVPLAAKLREVYR